MNNHDQKRGRTPEEWETLMTKALETRDFKALSQLLSGLSTELLGEQARFERMHDMPALNLVVEWVRRAVNVTPTELESLEKELADEVRLWAEFKDRYRDVFIPDVLEPYLRKSAVLVSPDNSGIQYKGFHKFAGVYIGARKEAVTLFYNPENARDRAPNFFTRYEPGTDTFVISRAYRMGLPPGAGLSCLQEQLTWLCADPLQMKKIHVDDIKNRATYETCVATDAETGTKRLRKNVNLLATPLGKLAVKIANLNNLVIGPNRATLDRFGFLDFIIETIPK